MEENPIANDARRRRRRQRLKGETCASCGEQDDRALLPNSDPTTCYECDAAKHHRSPVEAHHSAGQRNHPATVPLLGNDHRALSDLQLDWPRETLRNPDGSYLLRAAACVRGWLTAMQLILERTVGWVPDYLEQLDAWLRARISPQWWLEGPRPMGGFA